MSDRPDWFHRQKVKAAEPPWWFWTSALRHGTTILWPFGRIEITGRIAPQLLAGPLLIAPNHIGNFDSFALAAAMAQVGLQPRFLVTAGLMTAPVIGWLMERSGNLRVNRGKADAAASVELIDIALEHGAHLCVYPEGRVSLDPRLWPERGKTGLARIALRHQVPVIPVSQWGAHEVTKYERPSAILSSTVSALWRQPRMRFHFGEPVPLADLSPDRPGDARRARDRINAAITRNLVPLRAGEMGVPRYRDPTRPVADRTTAAFPGGVVPDDVG